MHASSRPYFTVAPQGGSSPTRKRKQNKIIRPRTAVVVADDDDVAHFEVVHTIVNAGQAIEVAVVHQRANVAVHKYLPDGLVED